MAPRLNHDRIRDLGVKPCSMCREEKSVTEFYPHSGVTGLHPRCKVCVAAAAKNWRLSNPGERKKITAAWRDGNRPQTKTSSHDRREKNKRVLGDEFLASEREKVRLWRLDHPAEAAATAKRARLKRLATDPIKERTRWQLASIKRRQRAVNSEGNGYTASDVRALFKHQGGICWWCEAPVGDNYHIDHRFPLAKGGRHDGSNIVISCPTCNLKKNTKMPWEFAGRLL